ncbi:MAG: hypothetical protein INQ03_14925 [Candidatus Heimdallarchaeota archaeon]|nr:hypothetical protein [Candidatus Heimdallarchaeota archaeon]
MTDPSKQKIVDRYKSDLKDIFNKLTEKYDNIQSHQFEDFMKEEDISELVKRVIYVIKEYYKISPKIAVNDFNEEKTRLLDNNVTLTEIPTYLLSFSLEEGTWIVFFRGYYTRILKNKFDRLLTLESLIESGKGQIEDYAYYLLELSQISLNYIIPLFPLWKTDHIDGKFKDLSTRIVSGIYDVSFEGGHALLEGAKRVFNSKLKYLKKINSISEYYPWLEEAKNILTKIEKELQLEKLHDDTLAFLTILAILQKEIIIHRQRELKSSKDVKKTSIGESQLINDLGWEELDPYDINRVEEFKDKVLNLLYNQPEEKPIEAAVTLLETILNTLKVKTNLKSSLLTQLRKNIDDRLQNISDKNKQSKMEVELIQLFLPNILIKLRSTKNAYDEMEYDETFIAENEYWDKFDDNLMRVRRVSDKEKSTQIISQTIINAYKFLILNKMPISDSVKFLIDHLKVQFPHEEEKLSLLLSEFLELERQNAQPDDLVEYDKQIHTLLISYVTEILIKN